MSLRCERSVQVSVLVFLAVFFFPIRGANPAAASEPAVVSVPRSSRGAAAPRGEESRTRMVASVSIDVPPIRVGTIPKTLPVLPAVTVDPYADEPSRLRAVGLLRGPMPLRGLGASAIAAGGCTFDIDCEDGNPCTDDICDIGSGDPSGTGLCMHEVVVDGDSGDLNGDDCDDGLQCNGAETCQGAMVIACSGLCVGGDPITAGQPCIRATDCFGGGVCTGKVCAGTATSCHDNTACGSSVGTCQAGGLISCTGGQVCDEDGADVGMAACVAKCTTPADCDDWLTCNGVEVCEPSGLCSSPGNPCGSEAAMCLEKKCLMGGPGIKNTPCETFNDCVPSNPNSCGTDGPYCFPGRCCDSAGNLQTFPNQPFMDCEPNSWYPGDNGSISPIAFSSCPVYGGGIGTRLSDAQEYFVTVGPTSLSPFPNAFTNSTLHKLGDDYDASGVQGNGDFISLEWFRFAGGVSNIGNGQIAFEFYDSNGNFIEDVFFPARVNTGGIQAVHVLNLAPALKIPVGGFIVGHVLQAFADSTTSRGEFFWLSTDTTDQGFNNPNTLFIANDLGTPGIVVNFLGVCVGGDNDGEGCSTIVGAAANCPGGMCSMVPGVLAFELEGPKTSDAPRGGCCDPISGTCDEVLVWECLSGGGNYLGDGVACASCSSDSNLSGGACRICSDTGLACNGAADCPSGTCDLNDSLCRTCEDLTTACTSNAECAGIGGGLCGPGSCQLSSVCGTGACCIPLTGECQEGHTAATCEGVTANGVFQGLGTDCDPDCCVQPDRPGADHCEDAIATVAEIPAGTVCQQGINDGVACSSPADCGGNPCERAVVVTVTGDNSGASSTFMNEDSCFPASDTPGAELGWFEKITIVDPAIRPDDTIGCGYLLIDHCCTDPVKVPAYRFLYNSCPCGDPIFTKPDPNQDLVADALGAPFCTRDNVWQQFGPLVGGTYYYPIYSTLGGNFEQYQFHVRVQACPDAVCCVDSDCKVANLLECRALGGTFLALPNRSVAETECTGQCAVGSCCTAPGECVDNQDPTQSSQIDMTQAFCETTLFGRYFGGLRCFGGTCAAGWRVGQSCLSDSHCSGSVCAGDSLALAQPSPCPVCEVLGLNNCQPNDDSVVQRGSDLSMPGGGEQVADDFIPLSDTITSVCVWGTYTEADFAGGASDCSNSVQDNFLIRVYAADIIGLPNTNHLVGEAFVSNVNIVRKSLPQPLSGFERPVLFAYNLDISSNPITGLDTSGSTCYWLEVTNTLNGSCFWSWQTVDTPNNDYSAVGGAGAYGPTSARNRDMAFCLSTDFLPGACGTPTGFCCACDGTCTDKTRRECLADTSRWRVEDTCGTRVCDLGPPENDLCGPVAAGVIDSLGEGTVRFDNTCSNADGVNPTCSELGSVAQISGDIWYRFIAPDNGLVTFSTCATGPAVGGDIDTIIAVYHDDSNPTACRCPSDEADQFALAQWIVEPPHAAGGCGTATAADENCDGILNGSGGYISGDAVAGDCFLIRVGSFPGLGTEEGVGTLTVTLAPFIVDGPPLVDLTAADAGSCADSGTPCVSNSDCATGVCVGMGAHGQRYFQINVPDYLGQEVIRVKPLSTPGFGKCSDTGDECMVGGGDCPTGTCTGLGGADVLYVGVPFEAPDPNWNDSGKVFMAAQLVCEPVPFDFDAFASIAVYGPEIIPSSTTGVARYALQRAQAFCPYQTNELCWSEAITISQGLFGDVVQPFYPAVGVNPDFKDISAYVNKFLGDPLALSKAALQLGPDLVRPTQIVDFKDISRALDSFLGGSFQTTLDISGLCTCPSSVPCLIPCNDSTDCPSDSMCDWLGPQPVRVCENGLTLCTSDSDCAGIGSGTCSSGSCVDLCGRCRP